MKKSVNEEPTSSVVDDVISTAPIADDIPIARREKTRQGRSIVMTFGRFNPPTIGHNVLITHMTRLARINRYEAMVFPSKSFDAVRNPLPFKRKLYYLRHFWPTMNFADTRIPYTTMVDVFAWLSQQHYTHVCCVVGKDRIESFKKIHAFAKNTFKFAELLFVEAPRNQPIHASDVRSYASSKDMAAFNRSIPTKNASLLMQLYNDVRFYMHCAE